MAETVSIQVIFKNTIFREIYKNTWLKKMSKCRKKKERLWVVFCVHDDTNAFLEGYSDNKIAVLHKPEWFISLNDIQHVSPTICPNDQEYEFALTFNTEVVRFLAPEWDQMLDWVKILREKLNELKILNLDENLYSKLPDKAVSLLPTRDPTSPLPPPPSTVPPEITPGIEVVSTTITTTETPPPSSSNNSSENLRSRSASPYNNRTFNFESLSISTPSTHYEPLFQTADLPGPSNRQLIESQTNNIRCVGNLQPAPQPYKTLREQQVLQLQKEMKHSGGVRLQLRKKDCISSIAMVDAFDSVWICGWKQKDNPLLFSALHIGDQVLTIEGIPVKSAAEAQKILSSHYCGIFVNIVIKRIPHGQVFVIHREAEGQPLGIIQENNTAVIETVEENSLVARHGLTAKAKTCDGLSLTNWVLTEINGRPLNLFFKKNQVRDRLNSVGRDISVLVQPLDLIKQFKKQLRSFKNYKDYIIQ